MNTDNDENNSVDLIDIILIAGGIVVIASTHWAFILPLGVGYGLQKYVRTMPGMQEWFKQLQIPGVVTKLLPAPKQDTPNDPTRALRPYTGPNTQVQHQIDPYRHMSFWDRVKMPASDDSMTIGTDGIIEIAPKKLSPQEQIQQSYLTQGLKRLPAYIHYTQLPDTIPSRLSVPIGFDAYSMEVKWGDFDAHSDNMRIMHALIAGQTKSGKDSLLRLWFTTLTLNNTPEQIQFVIIDGKIDWMSPVLADSAYMAIPPAGESEIRKVDGKWIDCAREKIAESFEWIFEEVTRRGQLLKESNTINLESYNAKAAKQGKPQLPMLFFIASDVGDTFDGDLGMLVNQLIRKGRAYGIRMIMSMQDPVGEDTKWRGQIGLVMSGYQQDPLHDHRIMGMPVARLNIRPSQLPNPQQDAISQGLFVVRQGSMQYFVRAPFLPEEDWFDYIESNRFAVKKWYRSDEQHQLLEEVLFGASGMTQRLEPLSKPVSEPISIAKSNPVQNILTHEQIKFIAYRATAGATKTSILEELGFTNSDVRRKKLAAVEAVIIAARGSLK